MKQPQIRIFKFLTLTFFFTCVKHGNAAFGDYLKKSFNINSTDPINTKIPPNTTKNAVHQSDSTPHQESKFTQRRENFNVQEVRLYATNPTPMYLDREKMMMESLLSGKTLKPGEALDFRKLIYGADLGKEFGALLDQTSPSWDRLEALLRKAEKITRLPQSMYYDEEEGAKLSEAKFRKNQNDTPIDQKGNLNMGNIFKQKLRKINEDDIIPPINSFDEMSMNYGGGQQIYPFGPDLSFSAGNFRQKREINRKNYFPTTRRVVNNQLLRKAGKQYFRGPPPNINFPYPKSNNFTKNLNNFHPMRENRLNNINFRYPSHHLQNNFPYPQSNNFATNVNNFRPITENRPNNINFRNPSHQNLLNNFPYPQSNNFATNVNNFRPITGNGPNNINFRNPYQNFKNNNFARIRQTPKITQSTPRGTLDSTWKDLINHLNPIQQKIIRDLFSYGPPTSTTLGNTSRAGPTSSSALRKDTHRKQFNNSLYFAITSPLRKDLFSTRNLFIRELTVTLRRFQTTSQKIFSYRQSQIQKNYTFGNSRASTIDRKVVREWLKSLNPQDQKEIEDMFFNTQSSPLYDIRDIESIKNRMINKYLKEARNINGQFGTNNRKSTFISKNNNRKNLENFNYYTYEDLSRLLKQAPQDKLKIVNDWCDEIEQDLHRRFPTALTKEGETRGPRPFYRPTRYYPWELFSMLPPEQK